MRDTLRRIVHRGYELSGLIGPMHRRVERRLALAAGKSIDDGRPMPPAELRVLVSGTADEAWFSERGKADAARFRNAAESAGLDLSSALDVWDLGCGCGRIARWLAPDVIAAGGSFLGSDINRALVAWCQTKLPGRFLVNRLKPPTTIASGSVDLAYAYSVVTHLREPQTRSWLAEIARVLRPGGVALVSFHDEDYAAAWAPPGVAGALQTRDYAVLNDALEGSNYMSAWTSRRHFSQLAGPHFDVLAIEPSGREAPTQALAVLRARPGQAP
ncbi:MAG: class I SAM-dependent methyltransferase [Caulobacteraceae bacterium]|nr:class I SAM-dependent methyltransferase [Caulobacteraceae bacterium]